MGPRINRPKGRYAQIVFRQDGRSYRISCGTSDPDEIREQLRTAEAKFRLGIPIREPRDLKSTSFGGPAMKWDDFIEAYRIHLEELRPKTRKACLSRLRIAKAIARPKTLGDLAKHETLLRIRAGLLKRSESKTSAKTRLGAVLTALNWARGQGWIEYVPSVPRIKTAKQNTMRGRPMTEAEVKLYRETLQDYLDDRASSWEWLMDVILTSSLRLKEALSLHWTDTDWIVPDLDSGTLRIPYTMQKNNTEQESPMAPAFVDLLKNFDGDREGSICNPKPLKPARWKRDPETIGKVFTAIGKEAGIYTLKDKPASAHDLRRTCLQRLLNDGYPEQWVTLIARHRSFETTRKHYAKHEASLISAAMRSHAQKRAHTRKRKSS